ncbi:hypothetical protein F5884DRAFT_842228 [Xylogone sp. PMI_703]|nr:hypothetical protein F5884DRAFT_842228 [Xylogone sp. PMI_703]
MDRASSSQSSSTTDNPVVAVGRKVKSVLSTHQRPSVRILRESPSTPRSHQVPVARGVVEPSLPPPQTHEKNSRKTSFSDRFATFRNRATSAIRSPFSDDDSHYDVSLDHEYDADTVDLLDCVDPEVATLSTLNNVQNSLFVPSLGRILNRRPTYRISSQPGETRTIDRLKASLKSLSSPTHEKLEEDDVMAPRYDFQYAVLPNGVILRGWTYEQKQDLDDRVRHVLHSRRAQFKRSMRGFWQYVRRPLGLFITVYATLITLFGAAWVLFLIGWISLGSKRSYVINVVDNVLVALFAIIGDGLAPFRAVDTYHMIYIAKYHRKTWKRREKLGLPELVDHNDLPDQRKEDVVPAQVDLESLIARKLPRGLASKIAPRIPKRFARRIVTRSGENKEPLYEYTVLTPEEQAKLEHHERKFSKSHTFYKPHETETHYAFPLKLLVAIVILLDFHSALQISLGACTWGISYKTRPFALTTVILCCSITCNIMGGVLISIGDKRTRKKDVIERMMLQEITSEAIEAIETQLLKEAEERGEVDASVRRNLEQEREDREYEEIKKSWKNVPSLPKTLLGKGEDRRQPSLPQRGRRSDVNIDTTASSSSKSRSGAVLPAVQEELGQPSRPNPVLKRDQVSPKEPKGQKLLRLVRRADLDQS